MCYNNNERETNSLTYHTERNTMKNTFSKKQLNAICYSLIQTINELENTEKDDDIKELYKQLEKSYNKAETLLGN